MHIAAAGALQGAVHVFPLRVYVEDTDYSGLVYHANYLGFMERARTEMLRAVGIEQRSLLDEGGGYYAVHEVRLTYHKPARLDDELTVESCVRAVRAAACTLAQRVKRAGETLVEAEIVAVLLNAGGRPQRQPPHWRELFSRLATQAREAW